jgi:hypothetical protein
VPEVWSRDRIIRRALCSLCLVLANPRSRIGFPGSLVARQPVRGITGLNVASARDGRRRCGLDVVHGAHRGTGRGFGAGWRRASRSLRCGQWRVHVDACQRYANAGARSRTLMGPCTRAGAQSHVSTCGLPRDRRSIGASKDAQAWATRARCARWWCRRRPLTS